MSERLRMDYAWTLRQKQVLDLMTRGCSNTEIADALGLSLAGAKWHVSEILSNLQAESREEAADYWRRYNGLAPRFSRVFRGIAGALATKWVAAAFAVAAIGGATALAVAALIDNPPSEPTGLGAPNPSPTAAVAAASAPTVEPGFTTAWLWDSGHAGAWVWLEADETNVAGAVLEGLGDLST